jgi:hypothetical protein
MNTYRLLVKKGKEVKKQGTAWFVRPDLVVTAFHVVGDKASGTWDSSEEDPTVCYELLIGAGSTPLLLHPDLCEPKADVALLRPEHSLTTSILPLSYVVLKDGAGWTGEGYPAFHLGKPFSLSGKVTAVRETDLSVALQLHVDQRTDQTWEGMSGAAVQSEGRVIGLVTNETSRVDTVWAVPVAVIRELVLASSCKDLLVLTDFVGGNAKSLKNQ